jgi:hypothetical protein
VTDLTRLDGPGAAAVREQLVAVYRAALGVAPFFETEVETGWFAEELAGELAEAGVPLLGGDRGRPGRRLRLWLPHARDPVRGLVRPGPGGGRPGGRRPLAGRPVRRRLDRRPPRPSGQGAGRRLLERLLAEAGTERAWLITHDLDTPAQALHRSLDFRQLGRGPLGWHDANRVVLGAQLGPGSPEPDPGSPEPDPPDSGSPVGEATSPAE